MVLRNGLTLEVCKDSLTAIVDHRIMEECVQNVSHLALRSIWRYFVGPNYDR